MLRPAFQERRKTNSSKPRPARRHSLLSASSTAILEQVHSSRLSGIWRLARHTRQCRVLQALQDWLRCSSRSRLRPARARDRDCSRWPRPRGSSWPWSLLHWVNSCDNDLATRNDGGLRIIGPNEAILRLNDAAFRIGEVASRLGIQPPYALQHAGVGGARDLVDVATDPVEFAVDRAKRGRLVAVMLYWPSQANAPARRSSRFGSCHADVKLPRAAACAAPAWRGWGSSRSGHSLSPRCGGWIRALGQEPPCRGGLLRFLSAHVFNPHDPAPATATSLVLSPASFSPSQWSPSMSELRSSPIISSVTPILMFANRRFARLPSTRARLRQQFRLV